MKFENKKQQEEHPISIFNPWNMLVNPSTVWKNCYKSDSDIEFPDELISLIKTIKDTPNEILSLTFLKRPFFYPKCKYYP